MKTKTILLALAVVFSLSAQSQTKQTAAVLNIDSHVGDTLLYLVNF
jgi:hypothetical protein